LVASDWIPELGIGLLILEAVPPGQRAARLVICIIETVKAALIACVTGDTGIILCKLPVIQGSGITPLSGILFSHF
jgi:hypothetical protein